MRRTWDDASRTSISYDDRSQPPIDVESVVKAYRRYAGVYDLLFGPAFRWGRKCTVERVNALDNIKTVLEVGVGTGLSLPQYRPNKRIVGIDVSREMLALAKRRVESHALNNVEVLAEMDAEKLGFRDGQFDAVVAMHVMSVVPNPQACLAEMQRVCKPGGTILICNHFIGKGEKWITERFEPLSRWLGWRPNFALSQLLENSSLWMRSNDPVPPFGLFSLVVLTKA